MSGKEYKALLEGEHKVLEISSRHGGCWQRITYSKSSFFFIIIIFTHKGSVPLKKKKNTFYCFGRSYHKKRLLFDSPLHKGRKEIICIKEG